MTKKNQAAIDAVLAYLNGRVSASTGALVSNTRLSKSQVSGALRALTQAGQIVSEGATLNRVHRVAHEGETPSPAPTTRTRKTTTKKTRKSARTRTRRERPREASTETPAPALDIVMVDSGRVRLAREGVAFELQSPEEHARLHTFLDRMEPMWREP